MFDPRIEMLLLLWLPLAAAFVVGFLGPQRIGPIRWIAAGVTTVTLLLSLSLAGRLMALDAERVREGDQARARRVTTFRPEFVPGAPGFQRDSTGKPITTAPNPHATSWDLLPLGPGAIQFFIGLDGLNIWLVVLTAILGVPAVLVSWKYINVRVNEFYAWLLVLQTAMLGVFMAFDIVLFYVFFELSLVPLFFLIGVWGGPERRHAAGKFFIYTLTGSLITLLGVLGVVFACYNKTGGELTFSIPRLVEIVHERVALSGDERFYWTGMPSVREIFGVWFGAIPEDAAPQRWGGVMFWVFLALMAGFAIKVPLVPFHTWLPLAHVEAPTAGSVDLAGVLLKVGAYGFLRLCVPLAPDTSLTLGLPLVSTLAVIGIVYGAFCAYAQDDIKRLVAYSSVSHLGLCMLGMFALNAAGIAGSIMQMVNHGLSTAGLFLLVGMLYERYHTRKISDYGGMAGRMPLLGVFMVFIVLTSVGLPGLNGFIGEVLSLMGVYESQVSRGQFPIYAVIGGIGMFLGAWYLLTMLQRVFFGPVKEPPVPHDAHDPITDLNSREIITMVPVAIMCVLIGLFPQPLLETMRPDVSVIENMAEDARARQGTLTAGAETGGAVVENDREGAAP